MLHIYDDIISIENLLIAWEEFLRGKRKRKDVQEFQLRLMDNLFDLQRDLANKTYQHGSYKAFNISDPKPRNIHKATVRDRLLHHAIYRKLYLYFDKKFIFHSYSCRKHKGTHRALRAYTTMARQASANDTKTAWVLKCDIKKFFASIDHSRLYKILEQHLVESNLHWLLHQVVDSFHSRPGKGLPLGNLTSQLLVNIYMNEFDQFVKYTLKAKYYIRYADDFVVLARDREYLLAVLAVMHQFLKEKLALKVHPDKLSIGTVASGIDFLGWVHFPHHRVLRTSTKRRLLKGVKGKTAESPVVQSYFGLCKHGNTHKVLREADILQNLGLCGRLRHV